MKEFKDYIKEDCGCGCDELSETSGEYKGKKVDLDNPFRLPQGSDKKFGVYVKNPKTGNVIMVKFGDPNLSIKRDDPERLKNFRARHNCDQKTDKTTPGYWSCKFWEKDSPVSKLLSKGDVTEDVQLDEAAYGHTLWIDPKGKIYDMNDRKEITDPKGHPYTHYDWVAANFTKYFGKTEPDNMGRVVYDAPHEKGWARIRNNSREIDVEVNMKKLTRSQKKALRDIVDAGPEYGNKGINRPMYIDAWVKNKKSRAGDKAYSNYEEIVDFLSEGVLDEGIDSLKGWVNPKTKKAYITRKMRPYHVEFIVKKPKDFGLTKKQIMDHLEKRFDAMDAPDPKESAENAYQDILADRVDIDRGIELLAMKKGWYRVVGGKWGSLAGEKKLNDRQIGVILSMMEDEGLIGDASDVYTQEVGLEYYKEFDDPMIHPSVKYYGEIKGHEIQNLIKGKPRGAKRTEIGQTMAMFRGESLEVTQLDEAVNPKDMLRIFNDLDKGDTIKVKFKSVMASASKNFVELIVTSGRRTVGKAKVERIILKSKKNPGGVKYYLYRRGDNVSFAMGDMAGIIDDIQENVQIDEGLKDRLVAKLMKMTPVAQAIAKNPNTSQLAMTLLAVPAINKILARANYDNLQKVIDLADFMKDTVASLGAETEKRGRGGDVSLTGLGDSPHIGSPSRNLIHKQVEDRVMKYSEFLDEKTYAKSGLGKWMNQQSAGGGAGWDRYGTEGQKLGKCGDAKEGEPYSACLSRQKAEKLGKKGIASFVRRKRAAQDKKGRGDIGDGGKGQKPINVKTGVTDKDPKKKGIQDSWSAKYKKGLDS